MYPSVTQFETRRRQVEEWIAARETSRNARKHIAPVRTGPRWFARLVSPGPGRFQTSPSSTPIPQLRSLPRREREALHRLSSTIAVPAGSRVLIQGHDAESFFLIERGHVAVIQDEHHLTDLGPGDFFGEIALIQRRPRTASVVATTDAHVRVVSQREFVTAMRILPAFARVLEDATRTRLLSASS